MAKTPEERPEMGASSPSAVPSTPPTPPLEVEKGARAATARIDGKSIRYNPTPGFRLLVCRVSDYGEALDEPRMKAFGPPKPGATDQAEYLLTVDKPKSAKPVDWWREATPEEMAAYQNGMYGSEPAPAFGVGPVAEELFAEWRTRHPRYRAGPPPHPEAEARRQLAVDVAGTVADAITASRKGGTP